MNSRVELGHSLKGVIAGSLTSAKSITVANGISLMQGRIHEAQGPKALGMAMILARQCEGHSLWIGKSDHVQGLRARALQSILGEKRIVTVQCADRRETLWAGEEALRCTGAGLVIIHLDLGPDLFESRRLQVAAQVGSTLGLVIIGRRAQSSAAQTRWDCAGHHDDANAWVWSQTKNKQGQCLRWSVTPSVGSTPPPDLIPKQSVTQTKGGPQDAKCFTSLSVALAPPARARPLAPT